MKKQFNKSLFVILATFLAWNADAQTDDVYFNDKTDKSPIAYTANIDKDQNQNNRSYNVSENNNSSGYENNSTFNANTGSGYDDDYYSYNNDYGYGYGANNEDYYYTRRLRNFHSNYGFYDPYFYDPFYSYGYSPSFQVVIGGGSYWNYNRFYRNNNWWNCNPYSFGYYNDPFYNSFYSPYYSYSPYYGYNSYYGYPYVINNYYYNDYNGNGRYTDNKVYGTRRGNVTTNPWRQTSTDQR